MSPLSLSFFLVFLLSHSIPSPFFPRLTSLPFPLYSSSVDFPTLPFQLISQFSFSVSFFLSSTLSYSPLSVLSLQPSFSLFVFFLSVSLFPLPYSRSLSLTFLSPSFPTSPPTPAYYHPFFLLTFSQRVPLFPLFKFPLFSCSFLPSPSLFLLLHLPVIILSDSFLEPALSPSFLPSLSICSFL